MKKFIYHYGRVEIVEVVKDTPKTVTLRFSGSRSDRRMLKDGLYAPVLRDSWAEIKQVVIDDAAYRVKLAKENVARAERALAAAENLQEPTA